MMGSSMRTLNEGETMIRKDEDGYKPRYCGREVKRYDHGYCSFSWVKGGVRPCRKASAHHLMSIVYNWDTAFLEADDMES